MRVINAIYEKFSLGLLFAGVITVAGCSTYGTQTANVRTFIESGDYAAASEATNELSTDGKDRLLHYMESGMVQHLSQNYDGSNAKLDQAASIAEDLTTKRAGDVLKEALISPSQSDYAGQEFERAFIHYIKALNYTMMALANPAEKIEHIESARIESRKVDILLSDVSAQKGSYQDAKDEEGQLFSKLMKIFAVLNGKLDKDKLIYREDAYVRYMNGLIYEINGELDGARIAYQKAAELYEQGYSKQYGLGKSIVQQAWFDTIRVMKQDGGYENEWPNLAKQKLSDAQQKELEGSGQAQIVVIGHAGWVPPRGELNMHLTLENTELVIKPVLTGTPQEQEAQQAWFQLMYADRGLLQMLDNMQSRGVIGALEGLNSKRVGLGPLWGIAEQIGLPKALETVGARVTVPYYRFEPKAFGTTQVILDGKQSGEMIQVESLANLAYQGQLLNADSDLQSALGRTVTKNLLCSQIENELGKIACKSAAALSSQADTRAWLTLPHSIYVKRLSVAPGTHQITLRTPSANGGPYHEVTKSVEVGDGAIIILQEHILPMQNTAVAQQAASSQTMWLTKR